jgi:uncharacterized protein
VTVTAVLIFGAAGAFLGHRLPIPAGALIGTLVAVSAVSIGVDLLGLPQLPVPSPFRWILQIVLGMVVGLRMDRESLRAGARALLPASLLAAILVSSTVVVALIAAPLTSADIVTTLFAAAPGGLTEMTLMSLNFGADSAAVAAVQLVRVLLALVVIDILLKRLGPQGGSESQEQDDAPTGKNKNDYKEDLKSFGVAVPWGVLGGIVGIVSTLPAGGIVGALAGSAAFRLLTGRSVPIKNFRLGVQVLAGGAIGLEVSSDFLGEFVKLAGAGALIIFVQMLLWLALSWMLVRVFSYDLLTSTLASSPGGISGVVPAADDVGADVVLVTFVHLVRLSTIVVVVPILIVLFFGR